MLAFMCACMWCFTLEDVSIYNVLLCVEVDTINPAPGVTIHEGGRSVHGVRVNTPSTVVLTSLSKLRPVVPADHHHRMPVEASLEGSPHRRTETVP